MAIKHITLLVPLLIVAIAGCSSRAGNVALGAGAAGGVYEYSNKRQIENLERDLDEGKISQEEYDRRRKEIENRSIVY